MICLRRANRFSRIAAVLSGRLQRGGTRFSCRAVGWHLVASLALPGIASLCCPAARGESRADLSLGSLLKKPGDLSLTITGEHRAAALAHYSTALQLEDAGKSREALVHYREVMKADPSNAALVAHTAEVAMNFGSRDEAMAILRESVKTNPGSAEHYLNLVRFLATYAPDDPFQKESAASTMAEALKKFPHDASVYRAAVTMHLSGGGGGRERAAKTLDEGLQQTVADPAYWLTLGRAAQEVWPPGQQELKQAHRDKINPFYEKALRAAGTGAPSAEARLQVAQYYLLTNQLPEATALCEKLAADSGSTPARKMLFRLYQANNQADKAYTTLQAIVKDNPGDVEQRKILAEMCEQRQDAPQAITNLEAAIQTGGGDAQDYKALARLMLQAQQYDRLISLSQRTTALFPDQIEFRVYAGMACRSQKRWIDAVQHFEKAERTAGEMSSDPLNFFFYYQYGITLERAGRFDEGAKQLEKSIELTPKERSEFAAQTMNYLGYMWIDQGRNLEKAGQLVRRANELEPNNAAFIDSLGWLHFKKGDFKAALSELLRARDILKELQPEDAEIVDHIAQTYDKLGEKDKALEHWKKAQELDPDNERIKERLDEALGKPKPKPQAKPVDTPPEKETKPAPAAAKPAKA